MDQEQTKRATETATANIREIFERFRVPGFDFNAFIEARQADIDAMSRASAVTFAGAQTITENQAELLKSALGEINEAVKARSSSSETGFSDLVKKESDLVQTTLSRTFEGMKDMAEAAQKSQTEVYQIALDRVRANAEQLRSAFRRDEK